MRFDEYGLPIEDNASDFQDSVRLAGIMTTFDWPVKVDLTQYVVTYMLNGFLRLKYVRHPKEYIHDFSRDQFICLAAGLSRQKKDLVSLEYVIGKDYMSPTVRGHERRCKGLKATLWQDAWLVGDILAYAIESLWNIDESNQLLCMVEIAGKNWLKFFCLITPWKKALKKYWIETRAKPEIELCDHVIKYIERKINGT